jgi:hypothetical protein
MKKIYIAPEVKRRRVFLEKGIATKASVITSGAGSMKQTDWNGVPDELAGAGTDAQGDLWVGY